MHTKSSLAEGAFAIALLGAAVFVCLLHFSRGWPLLAYFALAAAVMWITSRTPDAAWHKWLWVAVGIVTLLVFWNTPGSFG